MLEYACRSERELLEVEVIVGRGENNQKIRELITLQAS